MSTADTSWTDRHKIQAREPIGSAYQLSISNKMILSSLYWVMKWSYFFLIWVRKPLISPKHKDNPKTIVERKKLLLDIKENKQRKNEKFDDFMVFNLCEDSEKEDCQGWEIQQK